MRDFDYIWVNHQTLPASIIKELKDCVKIPIFIFNHMSPFENIPIERPYIWDLEEKLASISVFNSQETLKEQKGFFKSSQLKIVLPNPAPEEFSKIIIEPNKSVKKVLIVSNHVPPEIFSAGKLLNKKGISVTYASTDSIKPLLIDAVYISRFDVVISIGKTVQYCLTAGVPIYVYDYFGGPGYINTDNFLASEEKNFSGRGFEVKTAENIAEEIIKNYTDALNYQRDRRVDFIYKFSIHKTLPLVINELNTKKAPRFTKRYVDYLLITYRKNSDDLIYMRQQQKMIKKNMINLEKSNKQKNILDKELVKKRNELAEIKNSYLWKLIQPIRKINLLIKNIID